MPRIKPTVRVQGGGCGKLMERKDWTVMAANARNVQPWLESLAYRVDSPKGRIIFTDDTEPCESINRLVKGADVLVVNCWDHQEAMERNGEAPGQTGTIDTAKLAEDTGVQKLVITHTDPNISKPGSKEKAKADISSFYRGEIVFGEELMELWLS